MIMTPSVSVRSSRAGRRIRGLILIAAMPLSLAGCMTSKQPLLDQASVDPALGAGGRYVTYEAAGHGRYKRDETIEIRAKAVGYDYIENGRTTPITLHGLGKNLFVAQARADSGYNHVVFKIRGAEIFIYPAECTEQSRRRFAAFGVAVRQSECILDNARDPKAFFTMITRGAPNAKLVRE
jgi:hypothetical protein